MFFYSNHFLEFYSLFVKSIKTQSLMKFSFVWSWRFMNISNIVLAISFTYNGKKILKYFNNPILFKYSDNNHRKISKSFVFRLVFYVSIILYLIIFTYHQSDDFNFFRLLIFTQQYFGYTYMFFFFDHYLFMFSLSKKTLDKLEQKLDKFNDNLTKDDTFELINDIKALSYNLYEFNRISSTPLFFILISTVFSYLNNIVVFFGDIRQSSFPGHQMVYFHFFLNILRTIIIYILSWTAQNIIKQFDDIYFCLFDKSIETLRNYYSKYQKYSKAISLSNALQIYELAVYRRHFKSYYFYEILPLCLGSFGYICIFILQYMIIFIETTLV
ncbi:hypothetical protein BLA29_003088 [Euroglyphus maynei]|uniref:Uncharacterized protein n=1 Tax=Euroglyphus maynei TaxID=6958 RepID=A0A1Y3BWJ6_EURMA|nr:hypothetical protein BLA29_003088 [Euroglyphus maynei]